MCRSPTLPRVDSHPEVVRHYRRAVRAVDGAIEALDRLRDAVERQPGQMGPSKFLAYAASVELRDLLEEIGVLLKRRGPLFGDRDRTPPDDGNGQPPLAA